MKEFFGCGRTRDAKGNVERWHLNPYVNCIHTLVGHSRINMGILVAEFDMNEIKYVGKMSSLQNSRVIDPEGLSYAVTNGHKGGEPKIIERDTPMKGIYTEPRICTMVGRDPNKPKSRKKADKYEQMMEIGDDVCNTLTSVQKDNLLYEPLRIPQATAQVYVEEWKTIIGNKQMNPFRGDVEGVSPCITSACGAGGGMTPMLTDAELETTKTKDFIEQVRGHQPMNYRIRKLTPRECFRLMGVSESDIEKISQCGVSQSQQYKMAGNSIVVDVLEHIFRKMFVDKEQESQQLRLF